MSGGLQTFIHHVRARGQSRIVILTDFLNRWEDYDDDGDSRAWAHHRAYLALTRATERVYVLLPDEVYYALYYDMFGWPNDVPHEKGFTADGRQYFQPQEGYGEMFPKLLAPLAKQGWPAKNHGIGLGPLWR